MKFMGGFHIVSVLELTLSDIWKPERDEQGAIATAVCPDKLELRRLRNNKERIQARELDLLSDLSDWKRHARALQHCHNRSENCVVIAIPHLSCCT